MKKKMIYIATLTAVVLCFTGCVIGDIKRDKTREEYYSNMSNYRTATAIVDEWDIESSWIRIRVSNYPEEFYSTSPDSWCYFEISGKDNVDIVLENGITSKLAVGKEIEFVSAPEVFWSGYTRPIVSITIDGVVLLDQDVGIENYLATI